MTSNEMELLKCIQLVINSPEEWYKPSLYKDTVYEYRKLRRNDSQKALV